MVLALAPAPVLPLSALDREHHLVPAHHSSARALVPLGPVQALEQASSALDQEVVGLEIRLLLDPSRGLTEIRN